MRTIAAIAVGAVTSACLSCARAPGLSSAVQSPAKSASTHPTTQPATRPAGDVPHPPQTAAEQERLIRSAPVLVAWRKLDPPVDGKDGRLEFAAWDDGMVIFRKSLPGSIGMTLVLGRLDPADVAQAMNALQTAGFFRAEPFNYASNFMVLARHNGRGNVFSVDWELKTMPEVPAGALKADAVAQRSVWNSLIDQITQLHEVEMWERLSNNLDSHGEYRGYNDRAPGETWWMKERSAKVLWYPPRGAAASTAPASSRPAESKPSNSAR